MLRVSVPATSANLGPGYDVLGLAVGLRNRFDFSRADRWSAEGEDLDPEDHLALHTAVRAAAHFGATCPPLSVTQDEQIPRARGLGSSATARVAGLAAALHFGHIEVPLDDQLAFLADEEGHPDNAVPARIGGLTLCGLHDGALHTARFDPPDLWVALCIPGHEVQTDAARRLLPESVPHADAVHNVSAVAFLLAGLVSGRTDLIRPGLSDRLHQPYRAPLIGPVDAAFDAANAAGALGAYVSGSGSTLAALVPADGDPQAVGEAMAGCFDAPCRVLALRPEPEGVRIEVR